MKKNNEKENKKDTILIIVLIILIILLLLWSFIFFKKAFLESKKKPTGNVDVFEILCDENCSCNESGLEVFDNQSKWKSVNKLRIFENPAYYNEEVIAPLSSNSYYFLVKNSTAGDVVYSLKFDEKNTNNINMKYRLKKNANYVAGSDNSWVDYNELTTLENNVEKDQTDTYVLEWKWFESKNDTLVGTIEATYGLNVVLAAEQQVK
ncbi:MAG: hypothetical protein Q4F33_03085 [Mycoplasmatota bacterium]|nr:hypothetical protein [Mycoplasmatota bacterium]